MVLNITQILLISSLTVLLACNESNLNEHINNKPQAAEATPSKPVDADSPKKPDSVNVPDHSQLDTSGGIPNAQSLPSTVVIDVPAVVAVPPTVIAGALLTCSVANASAPSAQCYAKTEAGADFNFIAVRAFILRGSPASWIPTAYTAMKTGQWSIDVTGQTGSYGIALQNEQNQTLTAMIIDPKQLPINLVKDGSFEGLVSATKPTVDFQWVHPAPGDVWQARFAKGFAGCQNIRFEIQLNRGTLVAPDGSSRFTEINSSCRDINNPQAFDSTSPIALLQTIKGLKKDNFYEIRLSYRTRPDLQQPVGFQLSFGAQSFPAVTASPNAWQEFSTVVKANEIEALLAIEETSNYASGMGTLIDDVRIYDLGSGKE